MTVVAIGTLTKHGATYTYVPTYGVVLEIRRAHLYNSQHPPEPYGWHVTVLNDLTGLFADHGRKWYHTLAKIKESYH